MGKGNMGKGNMSKGKRATAAAVLALMLGLGVTPALAQDNGGQTQAAQLAELGKRPDELFNQGKYAEALAAAEEFAKATEQAESASGKPGSGTAAALGSVNWHALFAKRFDKALEAAERGTSLAPADLGLQGNRAHALLFLNRAEEAEAAYVEHKGEMIPGLGKWEDVVAQDFDDMRKRGLVHPLMARVRDALAAAPDSPAALAWRGLELYKAAKHAEALAAFEKYAEAVKSRKGENHADYAQAVMMQMMALQAMQRYADALPLIRQALALDEKNLGAEHPKVATDLNILGAALQLTGHAAEAEPLFRRALAVNEKSLGPEHAKTASDLNALALNLKVLGRLNEAEPLIRRALAIDEKNFGAESSNVAKDLDKLASLFMQTNHLGEAEPLYRRALAIQEKNLGPDHLDVAYVLGGLGQLLQTTNRFAEAETMLRRTLAIQEKSVGPEHLIVAVGLNNLAAFLKEINRHAEAEPLFRRALAINEKVYGPDHPTTASISGNLGVILTTTNHFAEAEPLLRRALTTAEKTYGPDHPSVATALNNLAHLFQETNRFAEAEPLLRRALAIREQSHGPDHPETASSLGNLASLFWEAGRFAEAEPLMRQALTIDEKSYGPDHTSVADRLDNLASLLQTTNRLAEAEPLIRRALAIDEKSYGPDHPKTAVRLGNLAALLNETNRTAGAEPLMRRALAIVERSHGPDHPDVAFRMNNLAALLSDANRAAEAESLFRRAIAINEKSLGPDHPGVALPLGNLANQLYATNRLAEAEPLFRRALAIDEKSYGPDHHRVARSLRILANFLKETNRLTEAEPLYRRALAIREKCYGPEHPRVADALNSLGTFLLDINRPTDAEPLLRRALAIYEKSHGPDHPGVAKVANNLAVLLDEDENRLAEAEALYRRTLAILEKGYAPNTPETATALDNLARFLDRDGKHFAETEPLYRRSLAIFEQSYGPDHPDLAFPLINLAALLGQTNRFAEAEPMILRALAVSEKSYGPEHPNVAGGFNNLARVRAMKGDWSGALESMRRSNSIRVANALRMRRAGGDSEKRLLSKNADQFRDHVLIAHRAAPADANARDEAFAMAQRAATSEAAGALAQAVARFASGSGALADLAREQQDLAGLREASNKRLLAALGKADQATVEALRAEQAGLDARLNDIAARLVKEHPDYAALVNPEPLTIAATQALLAPDEALVQFLDVPSRPYSPLPDTAFAFVITRSEALWIELPLGARALADRVAALRCGLDSAAWKEASNRCEQLTGKTAPGDNPPSFDLGLAHGLHHDLFGQIEHVIKDKRLLIAPSGALTRLPFQALVTEAPDASANDASANNTEAYAKARWLGARNAISVLPSAASLRLLRVGRQGSASDPFLGFGNPLLNGGRGDKSAWDRQDCKRTAALQSGRRAPGRGLAPSLAQVYRGAVADVETLRRAEPLPETADELCAVAHNLGVSDSAVYLGERATVSQIKALSANGALARARTIHFATHGLMAGETALFLHNRAEPALLMTPPASDKASVEDDGLLKASDVTQLKLNADWVVMSACNTAAGGEGGEALSGLARAFFYAGARSMLVSHWYVDSSAAVEITTGAFAALKANPGIGRDEALRRSLSALIAKGADNAHPSVWAPFVLVGDGGRSSFAKASERRLPAGNTSAPRTLQFDGAGKQTIAALVFSPDGRRLLGVTQDATVAVWDSQTGASIRTLTSGGASKVFGSSADGRLLAAASGSRTEIILWDAERDQRAGAITASGGVRFSRDAVTLSPDGLRLAAEHYGASATGPAIGVWDVRTGKLARLMDGRINDVHALVFSPDGRRLAAVHAKGALSVWNAETGKLVFPAIASAAAKLAAFSPDGRVLASAGAGREIRLRDAQTGRPTGVIASQAEAVGALAFSPDGGLLAVAEGGTAELWERPAAVARQSDRNPSR